MIRGMRPATAREISDRNVDRSDRSEADFSAAAANLFPPRFIYSLARFKLHSFHAKDEINKDEIGRLIIVVRVRAPCLALP